MIDWADDFSIFAPLRQFGFTTSIGMILIQFAGGPRMSDANQEETEPMIAPEDTVPKVSIKLTFHGNNGDIIKLALWNFLWNVLTLSFFRFWGRTRVRRYLWAHTRLNGEPFEYTGRGLHLFFGFLIVAVLFFVATLISQGAQLILFGGEPGEQDPSAVLVVGILNLIYFVGLVVLLGVAIYSARHYRLSHTSWRGIRGAMVGSRLKYSFVYIAYSLLLMFSYFLTFPIFRIGTFGRLMRETSFGDRVFEFKAYAGKLYPSFLLLIPAYIGFFIVMLIGIFVIGGGFDSMAAQFEDAFEARPDGGAPVPDVSPFLILGMFLWIWISAALTILPAYGFYQSREYSTFADGTSFSGLTFGFEVSTGALVRLFVSNYLIVLLTLGILAPLAQLRIFRFFCDNIYIAGTLDLEALRQSALEKPDRGEGLAEAFDFGNV